MMPSDILLVSFSALLTVFIILAGLAIIMQLIMRFFPDKEVQDDADIYSAIVSLHSSLYPASKITKIEEVK
jgi:hypothetical protein